MLFYSNIAPYLEAGWSGDLATAMKDTDTYVNEKSVNYQEAIDILKEYLGDDPSPEAVKACCSAFANYI